MSSPAILPSPAPELVAQLALANRILFAQGIVDGFGHISVRHDQSDQHFLLSRNRAPGLVTEQDIQCYDFDGLATEQNGAHPYLERFIHGEIYRARPDVVAVVHSHSPSVIPFGVTGQRLRPLFHMCGYLGEGSVPFDTRDVVGDSDLLIRNSQLGAALAQALGPHHCVLMRGHGSTVTGNSIEQVVYRAIYTEANAKLQLQSAALGPVNFLTPGEARLATASVEGQVARTWALWVQQVHADTAAGTAP